MSVYDVLSKWQVREKDAPRTHLGFCSSKGKWNVPDDDMNNFLEALDTVRGPWTIAELAPETSNLVFDVDIRVKDDVDMGDTAVKFTNILRNVLRVHTNAYDEARNCESRMYVMCKPEGTWKGQDSNYKVGFKVILPLDIATASENARIADMMRMRLDEWLDVPALNDATDIVDSSVYKGIRPWSLPGSVKDEQTAGGYCVTAIYSGLHLRLLDPSDLTLHEYRHEMSRLRKHDDSRPLVVSSTLPTVTLKRKLTSIPSKTRYNSPILYQVSQLCKWIPQKKLDMVQPWLRIVYALKAAERGDKDFNDELKTLFMELSRKSILYESDEWLLTKWQNLRPNETTRTLIQSIALLVCEWKAEEDLWMNRAFIRHVSDLVLRPLEKLVKECAEVMKKEGKTVDRNDRMALELWYDKVAQYVSAKEVDYEVEEAIFNYMGEFVVLITTASTTEVVVQGFEERRGEQAMCKFIRQKKKQFEDGMLKNASIVAKFFSSRHCAYACGYTLDADYYHFKGDARLHDDEGVSLFNTFCGFAIDKLISPEAARTFKYDQVIIDAINELLLLLSGGSERIRWWLERWIAYPLQNRGKKTCTMPIVTSPLKGTGKSLFFSTFIGGKIYGSKCKDNPHFKPAYRQIQDINHVVGDFNEGLLGVFYMELDECGIFDGACKQNEKLKNIITESQISINQKNLSLVEIPNNINLVLCSNKRNPIKVETGDRRMCVIEVTEKWPKPKYMALGDHMIGGDTYVLHYYAYLMQLGGMKEFEALEEPPMTDNKIDSMASTVEPSIQFLQAVVMDLQEREDGQPVESLSRYDFNEWVLSSNDLIAAFAQWCEKYKIEGRPNMLTRDIRSIFHSKSERMSICGAQIRVVTLPSTAVIKQRLIDSRLWSDQFYLAADCDFIWTLNIKRLSALRYDGHE